jgi:hypothetical protein
MPGSDDDVDCLGLGISTDVRAVGSLGEGLTTATPVGAVLPIEGVASPATSTGENSVLSGTSAGGAPDVVTFLKASLWISTWLGCLRSHIFYGSSFARLCCEGGASSGFGVSWC